MRRLFVVLGALVFLSVFTAVPNDSQAKDADPCKAVGAKVAEDPFTHRSTINIALGSRPFFITDKVLPWGWTLVSDGTTVQLKVQFWLVDEQDFTLPVGWPMMIALSDGSSITPLNSQAVSGTSFVYDGKVVMTRVEPVFELSAADVASLSKAGPTVIRGELAGGEQTKELGQKDLASKMVTAMQCIASMK